MLFWGKSSSCTKKCEFGRRGNVAWNVLVCVESGRNVGLIEFVCAELLSTAVVRRNGKKD